MISKKEAIESLLFMAGEEDCKAYESGDFEQETRHQTYADVLRAAVYYLSNERLS